MATKKKKLFDSIRQGASGTLSGHEKEWTVPAAPKRQTQGDGRGTGSQTTSAGRSSGTSSTDNGLEILQAAQRQLGGAPYTPSASVPALNVPGGRTMTPQERVELVRATEEQRKQKEKEAAAALGNDKIGEDMRQELKERKEAEKVTFSDFLADPLYAISAKAAPIGRDIEGAARMIFKPGEHAEREKRRANYNASLEAPQKADTGRALQGVLQQGIDEAGTGLVSTADFILGAPMRAVGWEDNPLHKFNEAAQASKAATQEYYAKNMENASGAAKTAENLGVQAVAAVPDLLFAYLTAGGSTGAGALAHGGTRLAGREAALAGAEAVSKRAGTTQLARDVARSSAKNPMFWTSFARTTGNSYEQAKAQGASDWEASMYAIVNGVLNSQVEAGSGVQALPTELQKGGSAALAFLRSAVEEGNEEVVQGVIERSLQNLTYDADNALVSTSDENAIFNPVTAAKEWGSGAAVGGILGLPGTVVQGGRNLRSNQQANAEADERMAEAERQRRAADVRAETREPATVGAPISAGLQTLQNAAESLRMNDAAQGGNFTEKAETALGQTRTGQIGAEERIATAQAPRNDNAGETFAAEDHIDNRTDDYIRKTGTKAFQHEHPELHDNFVAVATEMQALLHASVESDLPGKKGGTIAWYPEPIKKLVNGTGLSRPKLMGVLQDIIDNHGTENYADAKRVEKVLDELLTKGYEGYGRRRVPPDDTYLAKKDAINGAKDRNSFDAFMDENWMRTLEGDTEETLRAEWEAKQLKAQLEEQIGRPLTMADLDSMSNQDLADRIRPAMEQDVPTDANGLPEGHGPMSPQFAYREAPTQTHGSDALYTEEERRIEGLRPEDSRHKVNSDAEVDRNANERLEFDYDGEKADLFENKQSWDDADTALAHRILDAEIAQARMTGDYSEVVRLQRVWEARGTEQGQALRQRGRFAHTAADIVGEAAETLLGDGTDTRGDQDAAKQKLDEIAQFADEWESIDPGNADNMKALIMRLNAARRTGGLFTAERTSKALQDAIDAVAQQDGGYQFLKDVAEGQLRSMSADMAKLSPLNALKSMRYMAMLSKLNTTMRNLVGNTVFDITETVSNDIATPLDMLLAKRTGRRTTALDASWASEAKRKGAKEAAQRAYIETALDVDLGDTSNRFEQRTGRTFKMSSRNPVERFLSSMEKWQRYMLTVTDEFAKGGARAEQQRGIDRLAESGMLENGALDGWAEETAKQRTFQNDGRISSALKSLRDAGNALSAKDKRGGSLGLGDALLPFAQVPGNIAGQFFSYSPAGLAKGMTEVFSVLKAGENATAQQQAQAVRDIGRGLNGTAITGFFVYLAAKGLLKVAGDDDKDKAALERDEGISGTQLNIDATLRALRGESAEWQDGDDLMSIGFLEPFNGDMAMAYMIAEAYREAAKNGEKPDGWDHLYNVADANVEAGLQAVMDLPAMSTLKNIGDAFEYSTADTTTGKVADAAVQFAGDTAASFIPNAVAGIAQGMDEGAVRVTRTSDKTGAAAAAENSLNAIKSKIPGLRETLPQALDSWGEGRQTTASPFQNWLNANILPGSVTKYSTNDVNQELYRLMETQDVKAPARNPVREVQAGDEKKKLTAEEQREYQEVEGSTTFRELQSLMRTSQYLKMQDSERAAAWRAIMEFGKAKGAQYVGGSAQDPEWTERGDGRTAQKAAFYGILQAAKQRLDADERDKNAYIMQQIARRKLGDKDTEQVFRQLLGEDSGTLKMAQKFRGEGMSYQDFTRHYANLYGSKQKVDEEDQGKNAPVMMQVLKDTKSDRQAMTEFRMILGDESSTYSKIETLYKEHIPLRQIVGYYNACNEDYAYNPETGKYRKRRKAEKIQWLMDTYGYSQAQAYHMYKVFAG